MTKVERMFDMAPGQHRRTIHVILNEYFSVEFLC